MQDIVRVALDVVKNNVQEYSTKEGSNAVRNALIEANGGKTTLNYADVIEGKCTELFSLVKEVIAAIDNDVLENSEFFNAIIDYRNIAFGDIAQFDVETNDPFIVSKIAAGTQELQRQRLLPSQPVTVETEDYGVKFYSELNHLLSGRIDLAVFAERMGKALARKKKEISQITLQKHLEALAAPYKFSGTFSEEKLMEIIQHVEAANGGARACVVGTSVALMKVKTADTSEKAKEDKYNMGFFGKFNGRDMIELEQFHKAGTDEFVIDNTMLYVIPVGMDKPIKLVTEGEGLIIKGEPTGRRDLQQELTYLDRFGVKIVTNTKAGLYDIA